MNTDKSTFQDVYKEMADSAVEAVNGMQPFIGRHPNKDVRLYQKLTPEQLGDIGMRYGSVELEKYMNRMNAHIESGR